ncbi:MAG: class I SAM-dependent methyltransferase [Pseudomonadota bacterium]
MSEERISFSADGTTYHAFYFGEHVARYALAYNACRGARVLDIACGEGYGSRLMRDWGAADVLGIDISPDAIARAREYFATDGVEYQCASALDLRTAVDGTKFDLIVSLETIEHLESPHLFLRALTECVAPGGTIIISCPNDHAYGETNNPFHLRKYTFEEFRTLTEEVLGKADEWLLGTPALGHCHLSPDALPAEATSARDVLKTATHRAQPWMIPPQAGTRAQTENCAYYVGRWGPAALTPAIVTAPQSLPASIEIWRLYDSAQKTITRLREENERLRLAQILLAERSTLSTFDVPAVEGKWQRRRRKWLRSIRKRLGIAA